MIKIVFKRFFFFSAVNILYIYITFDFFSFLIELYYLFCFRLEWETSVVKGAGMLESLEEERLAQLKTAADCYLRLTSAVPAQLAEVINKFLFF